MTSLVQELRYGIRALRKSPLFTFVAVLTLALGIGANAAIYSFVSAVAANSLPFPEPRSLVHLYGTVEREETELRGVSYSELEDWRSQADSFAAMAGVSSAELNLSVSQGAERITAGMVTPEYFQVFGFSPRIGRVFSAAENQPPSGASVAVLSHLVWQRDFGSDPGVLGRSVVLSGVPFEVIGVMPERFRGSNGDLDLWIPIRAASQLLSNRSPRVFESRESRWVDIVARLAPGVSLEKAQVEMDGIAGRMKQAYPETNSDRGARVMSMEEDLLGDVQETFRMLFRAVVLVLLIACINVSNLLVARTADRRKDLAIRASIGASWRGLVLNILSETLLLGLLGGLLGILIGRAGIALLLRFSPVPMPDWVEVGIDGSVFAFAMLLSLGAGLLLALLPMIQVVRTDLTRSLKDARGAAREGLVFLRRLRPQNLLVILEVMLALPVLVAAGLIMQSFQKQQSIDPGFKSDGLLTFQVQLPRETYDRAGSVAFARRLLERLQGLPGVESAVLSSDIPLAGGYRAAFFVVEEQLARDPESETRAYYHRVSPGFFQVAGVPMLRGQGFTPRASDEQSDEVVVSKSFADKAWPGQDPLGKRVGRGAEGPWWVVAGVVNDVRYRALLPDPEGNPDDPDVYRPIFEGSIQQMGVIVKTRQNPELLAQDVRRTVRELDPSLPIFEVATLEEIVSQQTAIGRFSFVLFGLFGALALVLVAVGIYGVTSYSVSQRVREIGVRMALGATPNSVLSLVLREALRVAALGLALGLLAAYWSSRLLESLLFDVPATNPSTFAMGLLIVFAMVLVACSIPAWRASRYDPMLSLKTE